MKFTLSCAAGLSMVFFLGALQSTWSGDGSLAKADQQKADPSQAAKKADRAAGRRVPNFVLPDSTGKEVALADFSDANLVVLVFFGTKCPIGNAYVPDLIDLQNRYRDQKVQLIGINANPADSAEAIAKHAKEFAINFPILVDDKQLVLDLTSAQRIAETLVLDRRRNIRYRGRIDDRVGYDFRRDKATRSDLEEAVKEVLEGKPVSVAQTDTQGCLITTRASLKDSEITFAKHVAPILQNRCGECHHPGTAAPFSVSKYEEVRDWSAMIKETVVQRRMPPWIADPRYGHFSNDLRMTKDEIDTLTAWVDKGSPFGNKKDLSEPRKYTDGWLISQPDIVFKMPKEYTVKATGTVEYQYFITPTNFKEDVWVQQVEARPGNRAVVHHIIAFLRQKGEASQEKMPHVGGYAPGEEPTIYPEGVGLRVPANSEIVWQVHYTPTGKEEKDCCELGIVLCKQPPKRPVHGGLALNLGFKIPAGAPHHQVVSSEQFDKDIELMSLMPHMHLRGSAFRYTARYPDGREEILLNVPNYDFNWQHQYRFAKPFPIPKGTILECVAHFDNSPDNPANPDATKAVRWGDQTWEEMMIGWFSYLDLVKADDQPASEKAAP